MQHLAAIAVAAVCPNEDAVATWAAVSGPPDAPKAGCKGQRRDRQPGAGRADAAGGRGAAGSSALRSIPWFNPIELFWGWLKARHRTWKARSVGLLDTAVGLAMQELPAAIAAAWAVHTGYPRECR